MVADIVNPHDFASTSGICGGRKSLIFREKNGMRALRVAAPNAAPAFAEIPQPRPGPNEVLIDVAACGLNFADLLLARGTYQERQAFPLTLGMEVAGTVAECGAQVGGFLPGDRVAAFTGSGGLAPRCIAPASRLLRVPDAMPFDAAAAFPVAYGTSHLALTVRAGLCAGETVVVLGAGGGVGLTAVEIAATLGARVIAVARGAEKQAATRAAGAVETLDSDADDLRARLKALGGVDVVYDTVGDPLAGEALRACRPGARYLAIGFAGGEVPAFRLNYLLVKNITAHGIYWGGYAAFDPATLTDSLACLLDWYRAGRLRPHVGHHLPFERAADGLEMLRARRAAGKIVIMR